MSQRTALFMDSDEQNLGNTPGADGRGRLHTKISNGPGEPIPVTGTITVSSDLVNIEGKRSLISVGATPVAIRVGGTNLANRKIVMAMPMNGKCRWGFENSISSTVGFKLFKDQLLVQNVGPVVDVFIVSESGTVQVEISEGA